MNHDHGFFLRAHERRQKDGSYENKSYVTNHRKSPLQYFFDIIFVSFVKGAAFRQPPFLIQPWALYLEPNRKPIFGRPVCRSACFVNVG
jgi:hypothetical protein